MYWRNCLGHFLISGGGHELPKEVFSSGLPEFAQDFLLLNDFGAVIDIYADFNACSIYDELWYTGIYYVEDSNFMKARWSCAGSPNPEITLKKEVISSGWEMVDETSLNSNHLKSAGYFNKDATVFCWAFSEGVRSRNLQLK